MTEKAIKDLLESTKIKTYRGHAPIGTKTPYIVFNITYPDNMGADDVVYFKVPTVEAQLYQSTPGATAPAAIEKALTDAGIFWTSDEVDEPDESLYLIYYYFGGIANASE